jgi:hypothetical protein
VDVDRALFPSGGEELTEFKNENPVCSGVAFRGEGTNSVLTIREDEEVGWGRLEIGNEVEAHTHGVQLGQVVGAPAQRGAEIGNSNAAI